jgi:hypothetical protein
MNAANERTWLLVVVVVIWMAAQYGLAVWALRDLWRRPRVRGENKFVWALLILIVPVFGPILYSSLGPTSFLPRPGRPRPPAAPPDPPSPSA